jgi:hypothetical protein
MAAVEAAGQARPTLAARASKAEAPGGRPQMPDRRTI